jgi:hypothetical protein
MYILSLDFTSLGTRFIPIKFIDLSATILCRKACFSKGVRINHEAD